MLLKNHLIWLLWVFLLGGCTAAGNTFIDLVVVPQMHAFIAPVQAATPTPMSTVSPQVLARGIAVYREQYCGVCHALSVADTHGAFGPDHDAMGIIAEARIHAADYTGTAMTAAEYIRESIVEPKAYIVDGYELTRHSMPAFSQLPESDVEAMVQLLLLQRDDASTR